MIYILTTFLLPLKIIVPHDVNISLVNYTCIFSSLEITNAMLLLTTVALHTSSDLFHLFLSLPSMSR